MISREVDENEGDDRKMECGVMGGREAAEETGRMYGDEGDR
jgi:hypothetical protein